MNSIGAIAADGAPGVGELAGRLPWTLFAVMAVADLALIAVVVVRRRRSALAGATPRLLPSTDGLAPRALKPETMVLRSGWWVPTSRARAISGRPRSYAWPLHREYMVGRVV